jgi:hypothetical protein
MSRPLGQVESLTTADQFISAPQRFFLPEVCVVPLSRAINFSGYLYFVQLLPYTAIMLDIQVLSQKSRTGL